MYEIVFKHQIQTHTEIYTYPHIFKYMPMCVCAYIHIYLYVPFYKDMVHHAVFFPLNSGDGNLLICLFSSREENTRVSFHKS